MSLGLNWILIPTTRLNVCRDYNWIVAHNFRSIQTVAHNNHRRPVRMSDIATFRGLNSPVCTWTCRWQSSSVSLHSIALLFSLSLPFLFSFFSVGTIDDTKLRDHVSIVNRRKERGYELPRLSVPSTIGLVIIVDTFDWLIRCTPSIWFTLCGNQMESEQRS